MSYSNSFPQKQYYSSSSNKRYYSNDENQIGVPDEVDYSDSERPYSPDPPPTLPSGNSSLIEEMAEAFTVLTGGHMEEEVSKYSLPANKVEVDPQALSSGNFGEVYKATYDGTPLAFKLWKLKPETTATEIVQEILVYADLGVDSHVAKFVGFYLHHENNLLFMATEFASEGSLESFVKKSFNASELQPKTLLDLCVQACHGLAYVHKRGYVHRDVAARNFLITKENDGFTVKITDFGLSIKLGPDSSVPRPGGLFPRRITPNDNPLTPKSDSYAFGFLLLHLYDFCRHNAFNTKKKEKPAAIPDKVYDLALLCASKEPSARSDTAGIEAALLAVGESELKAFY